jgi:hypothetical protein
MLLVIEPDSDAQRLGSAKVRTASPKQAAGLAARIWRVIRGDAAVGVTRLGDDVLHARLGENGNVRPSLPVCEKINNLSRCLPLDRYGKRIVPLQSHFDESITLF